MPGNGGKNRLSRLREAVQGRLAKSKNAALLGFTWTMTGAVFILDTSLTRGYATWLLYIFPLMLIYWLPRKTLYLAIPGVMTVLVVLGGVLPKSDSGVPLEITIFNRAMAVIVIWITEILIRVRKRLDERLHANIRELRRSNQDLEQFAYVASHDLQEPLRMVASFSELLARRYRDKLDQDAREFIDFIVDGARRMQRLINDLLAFSRVGRKDLGRGWVDCNQVVDRVMRNVRAGQGHLHLEHGPLPQVWGNESSLGQLFQNLIENGVKFHGEQPPEVVVRAVPQGPDWMFTVQDNGIGIDPR